MSVTLSQNDYDQMRAVLKEQSEFLEKLGQAAMPYGTLVAVKGEKAFVSVNGSVTCVEAPKNDIKVTDNVLLHPETGQIFDRIDGPRYGQIVIVNNVLASGEIEVMVRGAEPTIVSVGKQKGLEKGDRVRIDSTGVVVLDLIEKAPKPPHVAAVAPINWDSIGGHVEAKRLLREAIELPYLHPKVYTHYGKKPMSGLLMWGPPGCGKTLLAQACATAIGANGGFLSLKGPEVLDPYVGVAEANVRNIFAQAKEYKQRTGKQAVIFIDEAEAILGHRGARNSHMEKTVVPAFLAEMQGLEASSAMVILATNRPDQLDSAVIRDGRIDFKVEVSRPDINTAADILDIHLKPKPMAKGVTRKQLAEHATAHLYSDSVRGLPYSGALLAGIVEKATTAAIRRDLSNKTQTGLSMEDMTWAVSQVINQEQLQVA